MTALTVPFLVIGIALTAPAYAFGVRRLLGLRLPLLRTLVTGVIAVLVASPIITAIIPNKPGPLPALWFVILGYAIALLAGMTFLVVAETSVPSGSPPGPLYFARGLRKRLRWTRRYSQISRILLRRGLLPTCEADGGRSSAPQRAARLARPLRLFACFERTRSRPRLSLRFMRRPSGRASGWWSRSAGPRRPPWSSQIWGSSSVSLSGCSAAPGGAGRRGPSTWLTDSAMPCARNSACASRSAT